MKKQGYNARLDDSLGSRHRGSHSQSLKDRRHESGAMEKKLHGHKYGSVSTMSYRHKTSRACSSCRQTFVFSN